MGMFGAQTATVERAGRRDPDPAPGSGPLGQGDQAATGTRVLLLTAVLLVMVFSGGNGNVAASLVALVLAAAAAACALLRPGVLPAGEWATHAERVLVGTLVGALWHLATARIGRTAAVLLAVAAVPTVPLLVQAFTEPVSVALLAGGVLALTRRRLVLGAVLLGLLLASKQYFVVALPLVVLLRPWLPRRSVVAGLAAAAVVSLSFVLVDPAAFAEAVTGVQAAPLRPDSVSLLVEVVGAFSWPPPGTYAVIPVVGGLLTALVLARYAPRTPAAFAAAVGLTLLVTILLSKQAFPNYYFMASSALLVAAVAWPDPGTGEPAAA
jgi:hypothetical protein